MSGDIYTWEAIATASYDTVEYWYRQGLIARETWARYCYEFRDRVYRYSGLGRTEAAEHARRAGKPLPYSDREVVA